MWNDGWEVEAAKTLRPTSSLKATTDDDGKFELPRPVPRLGRYYLQVDAGGYAQYRADFLAVELLPEKNNLPGVALKRVAKP